MDIGAYNNIRQHNNEELDLFEENRDRSFWNSVIANTTNIPGVLSEDHNHHSASTSWDPGLTSSDESSYGNHDDSRHSLVQFHLSNDGDPDTFSQTPEQYLYDRIFDNPEEDNQTTEAKPSDEQYLYDRIFDNPEEDNQTTEAKPSDELNDRIFDNPEEDNQTTEAKPSDELNDRIFENLEEDDQTTEAEPSDAIATKLYPHQKQALNWMIGKENNNALPPFWEQRSNYCYNTITMERKQKVDSICGGILADDMGLGKTLVMISLIMTNFVDGKPLACSLSGCENIPSECTEQKKNESKADGQNKVVNILSYFSPLVAKNEAVREISTRESSNDVSSQRPSTSSDNFERVLKRPNVMEDKETVELEDNHSKAKYAKKLHHDSLGLLDAGQSHIKSGFVMEISDGNSVITILDSSEEDSSNSVPSFSSRDKANEEDSSNTLSSFSSRGKAREEDSSNSVSSFSSRDKASEKDSSNSLPSFSGTDKDDEVLLETITPSFQNQNVCHENTFLGYEALTGRCRASGPRGTLIICPTSVVNNWQSQFEQHVDKRINVKVYVHYGKTRSDDVQFMKEQDVVITTYHIVIADNKKLDKGPLFNTEWLRIVLDEGHTIRNPKTCTAKLIFELKAQRRWVLSGTPIQNSMEDLWSIVNFLKVEPLTDKRCWNRTIALPMSYKDDSVSQRVFYLMRNLSLRRTKTQKVNGTPVLDLPARTVVLKKLILNEEQRKSYDLLENEGKILISRYIRSNTVQNHIYEIFVLQLRLRQFCCHPKLVIKAVVAGQSQNNPDSSTPGNSGCNNSSEEESLALTECDAVCQICLSSQRIAVISSQGIAFCWACIQVNPECDHHQVNALTYEEMNIAEMRSLMKQLKTAIELDEECIVCTNSLFDGIITSRGHVYCKACFQNNPDITLAYETIDATKRKNLIGELLMWLDIDEEYKECPICYTKSMEIGYKMAVITFCGHQFCSQCIDRLCIKQDQPSCPICREPLDRTRLIKVPQKFTQGSASIDGWKSSAKLDALITSLSELRQTDPTIKSIIVSQFTSLLNLIEKALREQNFVFTRLDGKMTQNKRNQAMEMFSDTSVGSPTVFLLSLKAGGVGINLTAASRVFLMEPAWNPAAEEQCFDRCHRLGQTRDVEIIKFIIENSVEENMLKLQDKKRGLMNGAFLKKLSKEQRRNNYINDLLDFFPNFRSICS